MGASDDRLLLSSAQEVADQLTPQTIVHYDYRASFDDTIPPPSEGGVDVDLAISTSVRMRETGADYRLAVTAPLPTGEVVVDLAMIFDAGQPVAFKRDAVRSFGEDVAYPALYPYARQGLADLTSRVLGSAIELPLLPPPRLSVDLAEFGDVIAMDSAGEPL